MIFLSHGDKGGVGKSTIACLAIEAAREAGRPYRLVEGDRSMPDVAWRYADDNTAAISLNRVGDSESSLIALGDLISGTPSDQLIIVNLPAAAGETLEQHAAVIASIAAETGHEISISYSLDRSAMAAASLTNSIKDGLIAYADRARVFLPIFVGSRSSFAWLKDPGYAAFVQRYGDGAVIEMPQIKPDQLRDKVFGASKPFYDLVSSPGSGLSISERHVFKPWLVQAITAVAPLLKATPAPAAIKRAR